MVSAWRTTGVGNSWALFRSSGSPKRKSSSRTESPHRCRTRHFSRNDEIYQALVMSVRDYFDKIGVFTGVLEAISGGIDSALGAAIAYEAMGRDLVSVYSLPSRYNSATTLEAARKLARNFELDYHEVPIQKDGGRHHGGVRRAPSSHKPVGDARESPGQGSRIDHDGRVQRPEGPASHQREPDRDRPGLQRRFMGDMVGGLSVIGDLSKPDVYALARHVNRRWGRTMIPEEIFSIAPSAELKEDQEDPFDYDVVGPLVNDLVERGSSPSELNTRFRHQELDPARYPHASRRNL